ncbi:hypothetical protein [Nostoc sp.]
MLDKLSNRLLAGLTGELASLGIAVGQDVLEQLAAEADEKRLAGLSD